MEKPVPRQALFSGLVYSEDDCPVETTSIGTEPHYVILDGDFRRHVPAEYIDRQVVDWIQQQASASKDIVSDQIMKFLGKDDLFTKAMIDSSISQMDKQVMEHGLPADARTMLGMMGFKVVVNVHGDLINLEMPSQELPGDEDY